VLPSRAVAEDTLVGEVDFKNSTEKVPSSWKERVWLLLQQKQANSLVEPVPHERSEARGGSSRTVLRSQPLIEYSSPSTFLEWLECRAWSL